MAHAGAKQHTSKKSVTSSMPRFGQSPPTRDPGLKQVQGSKQTPLSNEIHKLQIELERYILKVKELAGNNNKNFLLFHYIRLITVANNLFVIFSQ